MGPIFVDASYCEGEAGISCIATDSVVVKKVKAFDPLHAEFLAIREGVNMLNEGGVIFTDSLVAKNCLNHNIKKKFKHADLAISIQNDLIKNKISLNWISREENKKADALAVYASRRC